MSDIRVSVQWKSSVVFAGEDLECIITFNNTAHPNNVRKSPSSNSQFRGQGFGRDRWKESLPQQGANRSIGHTRNNSLSNTGNFPEAARTHGPPSAFTSPIGTRHNSTLKLNDEGQSTASKGKNDGHRRSVSIVSIGKDSHSASNVQQQGEKFAFQKPSRGHARAASLQVLPWRGGIAQKGPTSGKETLFVKVLRQADRELLAPVNSRASTLPSPSLRASTYVGGRRSLSPYEYIDKSPVARYGQGTVSPQMSRAGSHSFSSNYKFPNVPASIQESQAHLKPLPSSASALPPSNENQNGQDAGIPVTGVLSNPSIEDTPRSSVDFYSMSNNSTETLASEHLGHDQTRQPLRSNHSRHMSSLNPNRSPKTPETLMMGYGHITGSFTLDSSLVNQSPFEDVKSKNIVGDLGGGGVVRVESTKRDSGLFGFSGWGNIGGSLGGLLGGGELSSIKDTKVSGNARSVPILSTPQSILFVDLRLAPGESRSYLYRHELPRGLPPSHKGRAMKITYNLVVGSQRAGRTALAHNVQHVDIPFRVLPSVNAQGDILGHDLMSPRIILKDEARIVGIDVQEKGKAPFASTGRSCRTAQSSEDFLSYVEIMLERRRQSSGLGLLSPSESGNRSFTPTAEEPKSMKEAIDYAVLKSNSASPAKRGVNRFEISRGGDRIATITLTRSTYRLGETVSAVLNFDDSDIPCYALHATLESSEIVDPSIALRSKASIQRVTRRVHASHTESTVFARRVVFSPVIPMSATPEFLTSGISHEWKLRFEFVTRRVKEGENPSSGSDDLLEELAQDERGNERGIVAAGVQMMPCETFDVTVPLKVYGATTGFDELNEVGDFPI